MRSQRELKPTVETDRRIPLRDRLGICGCLTLGLWGAAILAYWIYHLVR